MSLHLRTVRPGYFPDQTFLYAVLAMRLNEPGANISHVRLPSWDEHVHFITHAPYRRWDIIVSIAKDGRWEENENIGIAYITKPDSIQSTIGDEVGLYLLPTSRRGGIGSAVIKQYQAENHYLRANVATTNRASQTFFEKHGFEVEHIGENHLIYAWMKCS